MMIPPFVTWAGVVAFVYWLFDRIFGQLIDKLTDPCTARWSEWLRKNTVSLPTICKKWLLKIGPRLPHPAIQIFSIFLILYIGVPVLLAQHITLGQSWVLAEAYLPNKDAISYINEHEPPWFSIEPPTRYAIMLTDQQRLVGLGVLEDGELTVKPHSLTNPQFKGKSGTAITYGTKLTHLGKLVAFWRFCVLKS